MFRENATKSPIARNRFESGNADASAGGRNRGEVLPQRRGAIVSEVREPRRGSRFLSEREAATYLGIPIARLIGLRKLDLAMIEKGFKPHGPPPLWQGGVCNYASESLDEWLNSQSIAHLD